MPGADRRGIREGVLRLTEEELRIGVDHQIHAPTGLVLDGHDIGAGIDVQHMAFRAQPNIVELAARPDARRDQRAILLIASRHTHEFPD